MTSRDSNVFTLMVDNEFGVLTRITALIRRAGWNIRSLAVAETAVPEVSRLTICLECRHHSFETVLERLGKQSCVREISVYRPGSQVARELAILRFSLEDEMVLERIVEKYGAQLIGEPDENGFLCSVSCNEGELDRWMPEFLELGLLDIARTGPVALKKDSVGEGSDEEAGL